MYIMFFAQLMTSVGFSSIFPFLPLYVKNLGAATNLSIELLAGLVFSSQAFTMMIASPIWGALADRYGRKLMVQRSMFGGSIILLMMAFVQSAEQLVILRAVQGTITGTVAASSALVAAIAPRNRTGYAMGLLQVGLGTGVAVGPILGGLIADLFGYSATFYVTAALLFLSGLIVLVGVKEEFAPSEYVTGASRSFMDEWRHILSAPGVAITYTVRFTGRLGQMLLIPIVPLFIQTLLTNSEGVNTFTGFVIGAGSATTTLSAIYLGRLGDNYGHRRILIFCTIGAALLYFPQSMVTEGWQLLMLQGLVGIALGGFVPAISALLTNYTQPGEEGAVFGFDSAMNAGARSIAPLIGSAVAVGFNLRTAYIAASILFILAGMLAYWGMPDSNKTG